MKNFPKKFLKWMTTKMEGDVEKAQLECRRLWDLYGEKVLIKASNQRYYPSVYHFEKNCKEIQKKLNK